MNNIKILNLSAIDLPIFREVRGKDWVSYGEDNLYPQKLIELYQSSAIHNTCVNSQLDSMVGEGIEMIGDNYVNRDEETLDDIYRKISYDFLLFGGFALNVIWSRGGDKIAEIYHLPFDNIRSGKKNEDDEVTHYYYSSNWSNTRKYKPVEYPKYDKTDTKGDNASQIYYCYQYSPGVELYPLPDYIGAVNDINLDGRISVYHNSNISNGMSPGLIINFPNSIPSPDEMRTLHRDLNEAFASEQNAGKLFLTFSDGPELAPQISTIDSANDDYYVVLETRIASRILSAHRISSPRLVGLTVEGSSGLGNNAQEMTVAYVHYMSTVIEPKVKTVNKNLEKILSGMGMNVTIKIIPSTLDFETTIEE
jgi:capsid portal protein